MTEKAAPPKPAKEEPYAATVAEQKAVLANTARRQSRAALVPLKLIGVQAKETEDGTTKQVTRIQVSHKDPAIAESLFNEQLGTDDATFATFIAEQLGMLSVVKGAVSENVLNAHLATVRAIAPRDEVETLLACQMAAVHVLTMSTAASAYQSTSQERKADHLTQLNKLGRTFTTQVEALKRYRSKGEQKVVVEHQHVHIHPGGQAVVGTLNQGGEPGGVSENKDQPHERDQLRLPEGAPVLSLIEADEVPMPSASGDRLDGVSVARGERRRALRAI